MRAKRWGFLAAAAIPCAALLVFCGTGIHEWWLISSHQIAVIPMPRRGDISVPELPAARLVPLIVSGIILAGMFAYALVRGSRRVLVAAYLVLCLVAVVPYAMRML